MAIEFRCSQCGKLLRTEDDTAGRMAQCPECGSQTPIPFPAEPELIQPISIEPPESSAEGSTPFGGSPFDSATGGSPYQSPHHVGQTGFEHDPFRTQASASLALGITGLALSIVCCMCSPIGLIVSLLGLVFGVIGLRSRTKRRIAQTGLVLSGIGLTISIIMGALFLLSSLLQNHPRPFR